MKHHIILSLLICFCIPSFSQNTIENIREAYYKATERAKSANDDYPVSSMDLTTKRILPGSGEQTIKQKIYFVDEYDFEADKENVQITFTTLSYNFAARQYYEEYLYDDSNNLIFAYRRYPSDESSDMIEIRIYYDNNNIIKVLIKSKSEAKKQFEQTYSGTTVPEMYIQVANDIKSTSDKNILLMKSIYQSLKR